MRILGIDYGERKIGIAVSDPLGITAQPVTVIRSQGLLEEDLKQIKTLIDSYGQVSEILIGLPKLMSGKLGEQAEKTLHFIEAVRKAFGLKVTAWDERLTSVVAERSLIEAGLSRARRKKVIDQSAATLILQNYLDSKK